MIELASASDAVAEVLRSRPDVRLPLVQGSECDEDAMGLLNAPAAGLFPKARAPEAAATGLALYLNCWSRAHEIAQDLESREGSYWHAIVHRMEPDAWNSGYWFQRVGRHPIFAALQSRAEEIVRASGGSGIVLQREWNPKAFIDICESARRQSGSALETAAIEIQFAEWELLMRWCTEPQERATLA
jgi:hypothetical protein